MCAGSTPRAERTPAVARGRAVSGKRDGALERAPGLVVDDGHDRAVDEQALGRPLLDQGRKEVVREPLAAHRDRAAGRDPVEVVVELLRVAHGGTPDESGRS